MKKPELIELAKSVNLPTYGTKTDLIERIEILKDEVKIKPNLVLQIAIKSWARESSTIKQQSLKSPSANSRKCSKSDK